MKVFPLLAVAVFVFAGGLFAGRWFCSAMPSGTDSVPGGGKDVSSSMGTSSGLNPGKVIPGFDGTLESLRTIAKAARSSSRAQRHVLAALDSLTAAQVGSLAMAFPWRNSLPWEENAVYSPLLEAWAEKDADAALRWAGTLPLSRQTVTRSALFNTLGDSNFPKALALIAGIKNPSERNLLRYTLAVQMGLSDPEAALRLARTSGNYSGSAVSSILGQWAESDPQAAWLSVQALPRRERDQSSHAMLRAWAQQDAEKARVAAMGLPPGQQRNNALGAVFGGWAANAPAAAFAAAGALSSRQERDTAQAASLDAWSTSDPEAALKAVEALPGRSRRSQFFTNILERWAQNDPQAAAAAAATFPINKDERSNLYQNIVSSWGQSDPGGALRWVRSLPEREGRYAISHLLSSMVVEDPSAAAAIWKSLPRSQQRTSMAQLTGSWAQNDLDGALAFARGLENPQDRKSAIQSCTGSLSFEDPAKIDSIFSQLPAGPNRVDAMRQFAMNRSNQGENEAAVAWMRTLPEQDRTAVLGGIREDYRDMQSGEAKEWAALLKENPGSARSDFLQKVASAMASDDPAAAVKWAGSLEDAAQQKTALQSALYRWAQDKPADAMQAAQGLSDGQARSEAMKNIIQNWSYHDPDALLAWAATATGNERNDALLTGGIAKAEYDPAAGAKILEPFLRPQGGGQTSIAINDAAARIAYGWFSQDMAKGTAWVAGLPEGSAREVAVSTVVGQWTSLDPAASSEWVRQLPAGGSRDAAAKSLVDNIRQSDPVSAMAWAGSIADPVQREEAMVGTLNSWRFQDKEAARAAAEKAPLSETARASLFQKIGKQ